MNSKNKTIGALQKIPLVFYVLSFIVIAVSLLIYNEATEAEDLDQFVYGKSGNRCASVVVLLDYDLRNEYLQSLKSLEKEDSLSAHYYRIKPNSKVKVQYTHENLYKIYFLKNNEIADGFIAMEYLHADSCFHISNP